MILVKERNGRSRSNLCLLDNHLSRLSPARFFSSQFPPDLPIHARSLAQLRKVSADSWRIPGWPCGAVSETASHPPCSLSGVQDPSSPVVSLAWSADVDSQLLEFALRQASGEEMGVFAKSSLPWFIVNCRVFLVWRVEQK